MTYQFSCKNVVLYQSGVFVYNKPIMDKNFLLHYEGKFSAGYYNDMEGGEPVFVDGSSMSDIVKNMLESAGLPNTFSYYPFQDESFVKNDLIGRRVKITIEIDNE